MKDTTSGSPGNPPSIWANRLLRSLAGQWGTSGDPTVIRSMGQLVPLTAPGHRDRPRGLDEATPWTGRA